MLQISEIVRKTEEMFDLFNKHFYEGELNRPAITVSPDGGRGAYGWCSINEIWNASGEKYREINLCAEYLDRPIFELAATLLHEMAHLYNLVHGISRPAYREARQVWLDGNNAGPGGGGMDQRNFGRGQDQRQPLAGGRHHQGRK